MYEWILVMQSVQSMLLNNYRLMLQDQKHSIREEANQSTSAY